MALPPFDYEPLVTDVRELLDSFGRTATFNKLNNVPPDSATPWRSTDNPRNEIVESLSVSIVPVEPSALDDLGRDDMTQDFIKRSQQILFVSTDTDLRQFDEMVDSDGSRWRITYLTELRPGSRSMLYFVGISK